MAKKGQKFKKYSEELKQEILEKYHSGQPASLLSKKYGVPEGTISTWNYQLRYPKTSHKRGRPKEPRDYKERYELLKKFQAFLKLEHERK
ncbi:MAG: transposase [Streptococcaceae bacterium]|jgi:transposase-like protein|nr:transposase [Streptococcaceae bacterium]